MRHSAAMTRVVTLVELNRKSDRLRFNHRDADALESKRMECVMKLHSAQVEQALTQFEARVLPDDHPLVRKLSELFGDHTFFLNSRGLNVVEPNEGTEAGVPAGKVVNLANWSDAQLTSLTPHEPEPTEVVVILESKH
jgi:hypothetical protein